MSAEKDIFADCDKTTEFVKQWFLVDPDGKIVNTVPPQGENESGNGDQRYMVSDSLPDGFEYKGRNLGDLVRSAKALTFRIQKPRQ